MIPLLQDVTKTVRGSPFVTIISIIVTVIHIMQAAKEK